MAKLTSKERNALPNSAFAGPNRSYPVEDTSHAKNAKARAAQFASPSLEKKVDARANKVLHHSNHKDHDKFLHNIKP